MDLGNLVKIIVHYLLIKGMTYFDCQDEVPMMCALVCMVTNCIRLIVNDGVKLSGCHDLPSYYDA